MANYACEDVLHLITLEVLRLEVPSLRNIRLARLPGPFRPGNWRIERMDVLAEDYGCQIALNGLPLFAPKAIPLYGCPD